MRRWDQVDPAQAAAILAEEMPRSLDGDRLRARLAVEMRAQGITPPGVDPGEPDAPTVLRAWDRAWDRIKRELAPRTRKRERKQPTKYPWVTPEVLRLRRERNQLYRKKRDAAPDSAESAAYRRAKTAATRSYAAARRAYIAEHWKNAGEKPPQAAHWPVPATTY